MAGESLFESAAREAEAAGAPLASRMRPRTLDDVVGQQHLLAPGAPLRRIVEGAPSGSLILWGPPGSGKTTLASLIAAHRRLHQLSAVDAGVKDVRAAVEAARAARGAAGVETVLFVDEVHRFSKAQQDALLGPVERGEVTLVAATTENPYFSVIAPLMSRSLLLTLHPLDDAAISTLVGRALEAPRGLGGRYLLTDEAHEHLLRMAAGDARRALAILEAGAAGAQAVGSGQIDLPTLERAVDTAALRYDRAGDAHYDVISAFIKSVRGSDVDAALHYLARMVEAGEDPRFIARRLVILASEDVGLADPAALPTAVAAAQALELIGLPEARLALAQATIALALAPKSNAVIRAIDAATGDVRAGLAGAVPAHLRDAHYPGAARIGHGAGYRYPHDLPSGVAAQRYAPAEIEGRRYYQPSGRGAEAAAAERWAKLSRALQAEGAEGAEGGAEEGTPMQPKRSGGSEGTDVDGAGG